MLIILGRKSNSSLYSTEMATFEEDSVYNQKDAEGFIKLNALRLKLLKKISLNFTGDIQTVHMMLTKYLIINMQLSLVQHHQAQV